MIFKQRFFPKKGSWGGGGGGGGEEGEIFSGISFDVVWDVIV